MKLGDISKNISSAFNWTFNDNGNKIDKTRVRLDDFSPVHSTGTTRLRAKWPYALAIVAPLLTNYALDDDFSPAKTIDEKSGYAITATALLRRIDRYFIKKNGMDVGTLCINKNPAKDTPPTSAEHLQTTELSLKISQSWLAQNTIASLLVPAFSSTAADSAQKIYHYNKVLNGDWVIEDIPPPEKQEKKENTPLFNPIPEAS